jgi:hypothetical protein
MPDQVTKTFKQICLECWAPAIITAVIGGLVVVLLVPWVQTQFAEQAAMKKRQLEVWEAVGNNFTQYILWRSRLNDAARFERTLPRNALTKDFLNRKEGYVAERDKHAILLRQYLLLAEFYFDNDDVREVIKSFIEWHGQFSKATLDDLPSDADYIRWRDRIMSTIRAQSLGRPRWLPG